MKQSETCKLEIWYRSSRLSNFELSMVDPSQSSLGHEGQKTLWVGHCYSTIFNNSRKNIGQAISVPFAPRLYNSYYHAYAPGPHMGRVRFLCQKVKTLSAQDPRKKNYRERSKIKRVCQSTDGLSVESVPRCKTVWYISAWGGATRPAATQPGSSASPARHTNAQGNARRPAAAELPQEPRPAPPELQSLRTRQHSSQRPAAGWHLTFLSCRRPPLYGAGCLVEPLPGICSALPPTSSQDHLGVCKSFLGWGRSKGLRATEGHQSFPLMEKSISRSLGAKQVGFSLSKLKVEPVHSVWRLGESMMT